MNNPVRDALATVLKGDKTLTDLATGGVYHRVADPDAVPPYVIFSKMSGVPTWAMSGPPLQRDVWLVKGVGERKVAEEIDARCRELLDRIDLQITGKVCQDIRTIGDVDYDEINSGEKYDHVGAEYKINSEDDD